LSYEANPGRTRTDIPGLNGDNPSPSARPEASLANNDPNMCTQWEVANLLAELERQPKESNLHQ
jgi:hypothetical protein